MNRVRPRFKLLSMHSHSTPTGPRLRGNYIQRLNYNIESIIHMKEQVSSPWLSASWYKRAASLIEHLMLAN